MQVRLNESMETLAKRLKSARKKSSLTQEQLAASAGVAQSDISKLERGDSLATTNIVKLAKALGCAPEWLDTGEGEMSGSSGATMINLENNADFPAVRKVRFKLSAGASGFAVEYQDEEGPPIVFGRKWLERKRLRADKLFAVNISNGSMEPGLNHGDTVVVNTESTQPKDGIVFAINYEGEMVIKRIVRDSGEWWLGSDNADQRRYPRKLCDEHCIIIGEIVHKQSETI